MSSAIAAERVQQRAVQKEKVKESLVVNNVFRVYIREMEDLIDYILQKKTGICELTTSKTVTVDFPRRTSLLKIKCLQNDAEVTCLLFDGMYEYIHPLSIPLYSTVRLREGWNVSQ